jgi:hypothetical protein
MKKKDKDQVLVYNGNVKDPFASKAVIDTGSCIIFFG